MSSASHRIRICLGSALVAALLAGLSSWAAPVDVSERWSEDLRVALLTPEEAQSTDVVIAAVDEDTLEGLSCRSPIDRRLLSELLRTLEHKGARAIGVDLLLDQPSSPESDLALSETLRSLSVPLVVASASVEEGLSERQVRHLERYLEGVSRGVPMLTVDPSGAVRQVRLWRERDGGIVLSLVGALAQAVGASLPADELLSVRFRAGPDVRTPAFARYPAHAIRHLPDEWIRGRIVLVGTELALEDRHWSPLSLRGAEDLSGTAIQAHALAQLLGDRPGPAAPLWLPLLAWIGMAVACVIPLLVSRLPAAAQMACVGLAIAALWIGGFALFDAGGPLVPLVSPSLAGGLSASLAYALLWRHEAAGRRFLESAFGAYLAPELVSELVEHPERLTLRGERRELTFLFTDLAGYTALTERTEPERLVTLMNEYLEGTCGIILDHGGLIEKIVGDALNVMFNAPLDLPEHPQRAVDCALELDRFCQDFLARKRLEGIDLGVTRIGLHTGVAVVGNFGGPRRFDYSAKGDAINTAARLESVNRHLGTRMCVSEATMERCRQTTFRPVGRLVLKGRSQELACFEPVSMEPAYANLDAYRAAYEQLDASRPEAALAFERLLEQHPDDPLVRFHAEGLRGGRAGSRVKMDAK